MKILDASNPLLLSKIKRQLIEAGGLCSPGHQDYYRSYYEADFVDLSFGIVHEGGMLVCLLTRHSVDRISHFGWYGQPIRLLGDLHSANIRQAETMAIAHIKTLFKGACFIDYQEPAGVMGFFAQWLLTLGIPARVCPDQVIRLLSDQAMLADMRKVCRQNINWGHQHLSCKIIDATSVTAADFDFFESFHVSVAGRRTRSHASWLSQKRLVESGENFMVVSELDGKRVGVSLFAASGRSAYYSVGVYERELFRCPLSHYPIWLGIQHAREMGCAELSMGESYYLGVSNSLGNLPSEKECNISHFKRGFGGEIRSAIRLSGHISG